MNAERTPPSSAALASGARPGDAEAAASSARWKTPSSAHQMNATYRNIVVVEKRRRASELAAKDMTETLKQERLDSLRQKALDLQNDKWMYEDVHI